MFIFKLGIYGVIVAAKDKWKESALRHRRSEMGRFRDSVTVKPELNGYRFIGSFPVCCSDRTGI